MPAHENVPGVLPLHEPFVDEVRQFWQAIEETWAPVHWEAELANVIWMAVRTGALPKEGGHQKLDMASRLGIPTVRSGRFGNLP